MASDLYDRMCRRVHRQYALYCLLQMSRHKIYQLEIPNVSIREYLDIGSLEEKRTEYLLSDFTWIFGDNVFISSDQEFRLEHLIICFPGFYGRTREYKEKGWKSHRVTPDDKVFHVKESTATVMLSLMEEHDL